MPSGPSRDHGVYGYGHGRGDGFRKGYLASTSRVRRRPVVYERGDYRAATRVNVTPPMARVLVSSCSIVHKNDKIRSPDLHRDPLGPRIEETAGTTTDHPLSTTTATTAGG